MPRPGRRLALTRPVMPAPRAGGWRIWAPSLLAVIMMDGLHEAYRDHDRWVAPSTAQLTAILIGAGALLWRARNPALTTAVTVAAGTALSFIPPHVVIVDVPSAVALYTVACTCRRRTIRLLGGLATVALTTAAVTWRPGGLLNPENLIPANYILIAIAVGSVVRSRQESFRRIQDRAAQAERDREQEAQRRVHEERLRIARDLHDMVAHHLTVVNAQAGVAHHLLRARPEQAARALAGIRDTTRAALDDLRATVGMLREPDDPLQPLPQLENQDALVDSFAPSDCTSPWTGAARRGPYRR